MAHYLDATQLCEALAAADLAEHIGAIESAMDQAGAALADKLGIEVIEDASAMPGFGGLCIGFGPAHDGQPCPAEIIDHDEGSSWAEETVEDAPTTEDIAAAEADLMTSLDLTKGSSPNV